ncbi:MAG: hypothetical protein M1818_006466 [Claussenomyces sp. TS43310]|nr:MAG: hypothetical protein M1818_006466 [Claussenomyces sp. TS43310]
MTTISERIDNRTYAELLAGAVSCARTLRFVNRDFIHKTVTKEKQYLARRSLWFLYSIEVPHSMRCGIPAVLAHDWIDYAPPEDGKEIDWLPIQCHYANAVSSAAETLYSQKALRQTLEEREQNLELAYNLLEGWRICLPVYLQEIHKHDMEGNTLDDQKVRHLALSMVQKYHEAIFLIFFPWTGSQSKILISESCRRKSMELCVNSAQAVLATAARISSLDVLDRLVKDSYSVEESD